MKGTIAISSIITASLFASSWSPPQTTEIIQRLARPNLCDEVARLTGEINVTCHGATPDDGIDDTDAIIAALRAAGVGRRVYIPEGVFLISDPDGDGYGIKLSSSEARQIRGVVQYSPTSNSGTILRAAPGSNMRSLIGAFTTGLVLDGLRIECDEESQYGFEGCRVTGVQSRLKNITVTEATTFGFRLEDCEQLVTEGLIAQGNLEGFEVINGNGAMHYNLSYLQNEYRGVVVTSAGTSAGQTFMGGSVEGNGSSGMEIGGTLGLPLASVTIQNMRLEGNQGDGISIGVVNGLTAPAQSVRVENCTILGAAGYSGTFRAIRAGFNAIITGNFIATADADKSFVAVDVHGSNRTYVLGNHTGPPTNDLVTTDPPDPGLRGSFLNRSLTFGGDPRTTSTYWLKGDVVLNDHPDPPQVVPPFDSEPFGWVCVGDGAPGSWVELPPIPTP